MRRTRGLAWAGLLAWASACVVEPPVERMYRPPPVPVRDGGQPQPTTYAPEACRAQITRVAEYATDDTAYRPPVVHGARILERRAMGQDENERVEIVDVVTGAVLLSDGGALPGTSTASTFRIRWDPVAATNDVVPPTAARPFAVGGQISDAAAGLVEDVVVRFDEAGDLDVVRVADLFPTIPEAQQLVDYRLGPTGDLFVLGGTVGLGRAVARVPAGGGPSTVLVDPSTALAPNPLEAELYAIELVSPTPADGIHVRATAGSDPRVPSSLYLELMGVTPRCLAAGFPILCADPKRNVPIVDFAGTHGATTAISTTLDLDIARGARGFERILTIPEDRFERADGETVLVNRIGNVEVCPVNGLVYAAVEFAPLRGDDYSELIRVEADGSFRALTDFARFVDDRAYDERVPNVIVDFALGPRCDAIIHGRRTRTAEPGYDGHWIAYADGVTIEVLDETPGRADNGGDGITGVEPAWTGVDALADFRTPVEFDAAGGLYLVTHTHGPSGRTRHFLKATRPFCARPR